MASDILATRETPITNMIQFSKKNRFINNDEKVLFKATVLSSHPKEGVAHMCRTVAIMDKEVVDLH